MTAQHRDHCGDYVDLLRCHDALLEAAKGALLWMDNNLMATDVSGLEDRKALRAATEATEGRKVEKW